MNTPFIQSSSLKVPPPIWAGVVGVFWILLNMSLAFMHFLMGYMGGFSAGAAGFLGQQAQAERFALWVMLSALYYLIQLSFQAPLTCGFFQQKRWAYGLYLWSVGPLILLSLMLRIVAPAGKMLGNMSPLLLISLSTVGWFLILGLTVLQLFLVLRSKDYLVN